MKSKKHNQKGMAILVVVVIITASLVLMAVSIALTSVDEIDIAYINQKGSEALILADGCLEEAFHQIRLDNGYLGGNLDLGSGTCIIKVEGSGNSRNIIATGTVDVYYKVVEANISLNGNNLVLESWQEKNN